MQKVEKKIQKSNYKGHIIPETLGRLKIHRFPNLREEGQQAEDVVNKKN